MFSNEQLTSPDFDEVAYLRYALRASSFHSEHARLEHCIADVKEGMQAILAEHADQLIDQARCTHKAQREVSSVRQSTDSLQKAAGRLRLMIEEPYTQLQSRVRELEATQEATQLLQSTLRFLSLTGRLQEQLAATPNIDIIRASYTLKELEEVLQEDSIRSLQVVDAQLPAVERYATTIRSKAHDLLAMSELISPPGANTNINTGVVGGAGASAAATASTSRLVTNANTGLQCAYVLRILSRTVQGFMTEHRREVLRTVMRELDAQTIEEHISAECERLSRNPQANNNGGVSEQAVTAHVVLEHIQKTLFIAVQHTQCVVLLWRLILQKRDAQTQASYLTSIESPVQLLVEYWTTITEKVWERLSSLQKRHAIRLALASAYPRFHHLVASFLSRIDGAGGAGASMGGAGGVSSGISGNSGGGSGNGLSVVSAAALVSSIHVTQCGMGDFLDLIDLVDAAAVVHRGGGNSADGMGDFSPLATRAKAQPPAARSPAPRTDAQNLRHAWLAQVTDDVRDAFRTYVMDRHRELISGVFTRLSNVLPASPAMGGQPAAVAPVRMQGIRRPTIPLQANALDLAAYTRMITQEVQVFRQDPHTLDVLLDCILASLRQVRSKFSDTVKKFPLPPLPAITTAPTLVQVLHVCIANGCTTLAYDCTAVLACVPQAAAWTGGGSGGTVAMESTGHGYSSYADPYAGVLEQLGNKRVELQRLIHAFHEMSERSTKPFADSALAVLLPTLTQATDNVLRSEFNFSAAAAATETGRAVPMVAGDSRTALVQLQTQCRQFTDRFFFLIDARTAGWMEACQRMTDTLLARLLSRVVTTPPPPQLQGNVAATAPAYAHALQLIMPALLQYVQAIQSAGAVGRTTSLLRGCVRQVEGFYEVCGGLNREASSSALRATLAERLRPPVPAFLAKLLVLQYALLNSSNSADATRSSDGPGPAAAVTLAAVMCMSEEGAVECVEAVLLQESAVGGTPSASSAVAGAEGKGQRTEVEHAMAARYHQLLAGASAEAAPRLQEMWTVAEGK
ncbi:hypothetical protein ABB37_01395 [Leptomonas pyrrhocoris]|uniref:Conserved oligomeric Golgi complex subunit 5 n=1 Tax=Leptomonas pyrrhocoris TaxID=157538 RepID=A0A0N0DZ72_LEPPY|nr:hypothetical protein ABB37_01395 [Leptomonas pyrrhocoris]KPA84955.1 hypothetical protein ABB37_01395 [Leptomonas pyrrhocoris]|eukprot:XP_015663394.1 hypothetical protein ABB37_01395 [Leptomonas pyrrhocoris]